jgi:hypothetical protein
LQWVENLLFSAGRVLARYWNEAVSTDSTQQFRDG